MPISNINPEQLVQMLADDPSLMVLDVRSQEEFLYLGHLPQAHLIPLHELPHAFRALDPKKPMVVTCQHGIRSIDACYFLQARGFEALYNLEEGMSTWTGPVERDTSGLNQMFQQSSTQQGDD